MPKLVRRTGTQHLWVRFSVEGRLVQRSTGTADRREAQTRAAEIEAAERKRGGGSAASSGYGPALSTLAERDLSEASARGVSDASLETLGIHWRRILHSQTFAAGRADAVTKDAIVAYIQERRADGIRGQTIRKELGILKRALLGAQESGQAFRIPVRWPVVRSDAKHPTRAGRLIPEDRIRAFLEGLSGELRDQFAFALMTGMRAGELFRLRDRWVEPAPKGSPTPWLVRIPDVATKTGKGRVVGCSNAAWAILAGRTGPFVSVFRKDAVEATRKAAVLAGIAFVPTLRDCRATHASLAARLTGDPKAAQVALGHSTGTMTDVYLKATTDRALRAGQVVQEALYSDPKKTAPAGRKTQRGRRDAWGETRTPTSCDTNPSRQTQALRWRNPESGDTARRTETTGAVVQRLVQSLRKKAV